MHAHGHHAGHEHHALATSPGRRRRALWIALVANAILLVVQLVAAIAFGSLALLADTAHLATDVAALAVALIALALAARPASTRHTYGLARAEVLAAQANAVVLVAAVGFVVYGAIRRLADPQSVDGTGVAVVAAIGLVVNAGSAWVVARAAGSNLNLRAAFWHLASDALGSFAALVAGVGIALGAPDQLDSFAALAISVLVLVGAWGVLRDATAVLLEAVPPGLDVTEIAGAIAQVDGVGAVHHVHVWSLGAETPALSAHVVLPDTESLHLAEARSAEVKEMLAGRFGIEHATIEVECHACEPDPAAT